MKNLHLIIVVIAFIISGKVINAQIEKFGKINPDILKLKQDPDFPEASAVILFDVGTAKINFVVDEFQLTQVRHVRIKIYTKAGYENANVYLPRYIKGREKFMKLSAVVYNLDEKGKVIKEKVDSDQIFDEDIDKKINRKRFTFPSVVEGSVIEYKYEMVSSESYRIMDWNFQYDIPVKCSRFEMSYPDYFTYLTKVQGNFPFERKEVNSHGEKVQFSNSYSVIDFNKNGTGTRHVDQYSIDLNYKDRLYEMKNVPPLEEEPFIRTIEDYRPKIINQFKSYHVPPNPITYFISSWEDFAEKMNEDSDFGGQLRLISSQKKLLEEITSEQATDKENMIAIYDFIRKKMNWNGSYRMFPTDKIFDAFEKEEGNSADINLLLTFLLQKAGFESYPVLISTRSHGMIDMSLPIANQFNSVINLTIINGQEYFMNATDPLRPYNLLDEDDLYGKGFVLNKYNYSWMPTSNMYKSKEMVSATMHIDPEGDLSGTIETSQTGYYALNSRTKMRNSGKDGFFNALMNEGEFESEYTIEEVVNMQSVSKPLVYKIFIESGSFTQMSGDMIYLKPMLQFAFNQNPFKNESRQYPIDFGYSREKSFMLNLTIPEGYEVVEIPGSVKTMLPEKAGVLYFACQRAGNSIQLISKINLSRTQYSVNEYKLLKDFFDLIVAKQSEQIVLRKISESADKILDHEG
jgi:hypothetical protein